MIITSCSFFTLIVQFPAFRMLSDALPVCDRQCCVLKPFEEDRLMTYSRHGDIVIGGVLQIFLIACAEKQNYLSKPNGPVCVAPSLRYLRHLLAFIYAIEEINSNSDILPNVTLGFRIYDACSSDVVALKSTLCILSEDQEPTPNYICHRKPKTAAFIGHLLTSTTNVVAELTQLYGFPQVSYGAPNPVLSNHINIPFVYRTVPSELSQFNVIIQLLTHFGWTWVGIIASDDGSNDQTSEELKNRLEMAGICVAFKYVISQSLAFGMKNFQAFDVIKNSSARVIILYCSALHFLGLLEKKLYQNLPGKVWISSVTLNIVTDYNFKQYLHTFNGSLLISLHRGEIPGFKKFLCQEIWSNTTENIFLQYFLAFNVGCLEFLFDEENKVARRECSKEGFWTERIAQDEIDTYRISYATYTAVHSLAHALHEMCKRKDLPSSEGWSSKTRSKVHQKLHLLLTNSGEEVYFDANGDAPGNFDILNWIIYSNLTVRNIFVGRYKSSAAQQLLINDSAIVWNPYFNQTPQSTCSEPCPPGHRKTLQIGRKSCCFDCILCSEGEIASFTDMEKCIKCPEDHWSKPTRDLCLKRTIDFLSFEEPLGETLTTFAVLLTVLSLAMMFFFVKYRTSPIIKANNRNLSYILLVSLTFSFLCSLSFIGHPIPETCLLRQVAFGIIFTIVISSILGKTVTVVIAFHATKPGSKLRRCVGSKLSYAILLLCTSGEILICLTWLISFPPFIDFDTKSTNDKLILQCNEGSILAFCIVIFYIGILALFSFFVAFFARKLPDRYNEAQYITFSMIVFCCVWVTFIPTYFSTKGKYMVAVEIFAILASTAGILGCIFVPKCYILLLKREHVAQWKGCTI
ncbi:vomeronasal type-2 receptor 26-like [Spea bombifrons]|uniref:vomeronasal type-2 receptor 26-like n=1 Tax=Spea bombifrons TaxID=233779 RepID=UPI0023490825|nr:vomeronasal type-2 receptor 26-like [Spea bombifrons]